MSERIYISGGSSRIDGTVDTLTRVTNTVDINISIWSIALGIALGFLFSMVILKLMVLPNKKEAEKLSNFLETEYKPTRIDVQGVDCVVINRNAISCDWQNANPSKDKEEQDGK